MTLKRHFLSQLNYLLQIKLLLDFFHYVWQNSKFGLKGMAREVYKGGPDLDPSYLTIAAVFLKNFFLKTATKELCKKNLFY